VTQSRLARPRQCALIQRVERRGRGWGDWGGAPLVLPVLRTEMTRLSVVRRKLIRREVLNVGRTRGTVTGVVLLSSGPVRGILGYSSC